jgi:hypothetical protein
LRIRLSLFCILALSLWALRLATLESAFQADDSPETAAASCQMGIQHPPGYPLPTLLGRLASLGMPGNPAFAQNALAAAWACVAPCLLGLALWGLGGDLPLALVLALGLGLMPQLGYQASSAKGGIYTLNLVLSMACLAGLWLGAKKDGSHWTSLGLLLCGLGLAGHYMSLVLFLPAILAWSWHQARKGWLWLLPGLSLYLYLPIRAMQHPGMNWGDPETFWAVLHTLSRAQYASAEDQRSLAEAFRLAGHFFVLLPSQVYWPVLLLSPLGMLLAWRSRSWNLKPLVLSLALHWLAVVFYNNPPQRAPWVIDAFFLPDFALLWFFGGLGLWSLTLKYSQRRGPILAAYAVLIIGMAPLSYKHGNYSNDFLAYDYARDLQDPLPRNSVLLAAGGGDAFGFWYLQQVERRRPDICLVDVPLLSDWYLNQLRPRIPELSRDWQTRDQVVGGLLQSKISSPLYYSSHNPGERGIPMALVSLAPAPGAKVALSPALLEAPWQALRTRFLSDAVTPLDGSREELIGCYASSADALESFARRFQSPQLIAFAQGMHHRFLIR